MQVVREASRCRATDDELRSGDSGFPQIDGGDSRLLLQPT